MLFHLTTEDHIRTSNEPGPVDAGGGSFASERELQELACAWPMKRLVEIWNCLPGVERVIRFTDRKTAMARIWRALQPQTDKPGAKAARRDAGEMATRIEHKKDQPLRSIELHANDR